jgi:hypothetical protein
MIVPQNKMNVQGGFSGFTGTKVLASWYKSTTKVLRPGACFLGLAALVALLSHFPSAGWQCQMQSDSKAYYETVCTLICACMYA